VLTRGEEKLLHALRRRKIRETERLFLAEGVRVVEELLSSGIDLQLAVAAPSLEDTERGAALARRLDATGKLRRVEQGRLDALAATESPQGVLAIGRIPPADLDGIDVSDGGVAVVLDGIQDPGNFGTIVRSADAFGALLVAALPGTVDPWNPKSVRAGAGSSFHLPVLQLDLAPLLAWLRAHEFPVYGADAGGTSVEDVAPVARGRGAALVLGNEGAGLGADVRVAVDRLVAVPIRGAAESLNVGIAAGVLLYLLTRSR
jgi:TrmH family RNA methyltransferase